LRIRIQTRLIALLLACNIIPLLSILLITTQITTLAAPPAESFSMLRGFIVKQALLFILVGICLTMLVGRNLSIPFREIIRSLRDIRGGRYEKRIRVTSNDEIGYTGDVINEMAEGLKEREQLRYSLVLAKEVQQNLLPRSDPRVNGLDIAGTSIYCDETGGDYYDYLNVSDTGLLVAVGDVSDHGVSSAMLMTTARAFLRQRASQPGRLEKVVTDVNNQLVNDVEDSGHFMTAFLLHADRSENTICWVNAGHDSAMVFHPDDGEWMELERTGLPLGVSESEKYTERCRPIAPGQLIIIGTDGVWESQDAQGQMFGKKRLTAIVEKNRLKPAGNILKTVIQAIDRFCGEQEINDDITLVIIKIQ
jgi:sigma-B regulation protein RsbU (phosphoserine phosphatase)